MCRSRKVKCDGGKPICAREFLPFGADQALRAPPEDARPRLICCTSTECLKSAKGNAEACSCVYEGAGTVAKGAPAQPKKRPSGAARTSSDGSSSLEKRAREAEGENEEDGGVKKKQGTGGVRVETLVDRICSSPAEGSRGTSLTPSPAAELERRLRIQAESVPLRGSTTSSYPSSSQPALTFAPNGSSAYSAPTSSYPPLSYPSEVPVSLGFAEFTSGTISDSPAGTGAFVGGSSYPPLNYGVNASASSAMASGFNGFSVPSPIDLQQTLQTGAISQSPIDFGAGDALSNPPSGPLHPTTNGFYSSSSSGGGNGSLAASPDDALGLDAAFLQILYPSWPTSLPSPSIVHRLVHLFFARCTIPATIFNRARFLASLDLPPTAAGFPETALLHAMCSYAAVLVSEEALYQDGMVKKYWEGYKGPREYHYACARADVDKGVLSSSRNTFQVRALGPLLLIGLSLIPCIRTEDPSSHHSMLLHRLPSCLLHRTLAPLGSRHSPLHAPRAQPPSTLQLLARRRG